jgi:Protein of unknown function (DUF2961).
MSHPAFGDLLGALALPPVGRSRRVSSNEQPNWNDGNFDSTYLQPGDVLEMPLLEGPGCINHMWFTSHAGGMGELNALTLRIYWDGRAEPGVEAPLGDFFAVGQAPEVVESVPVQVSPSGSLTCYWRMPFARSARITVTNDNPNRGYGLYWQVDWVELPELPEGTGYFHARYRQEYPAVMGRDYLIADLKGTGQYVGTVMSVTNAQDGWFGEGDDFFYIDGEEVPSLQGTGSEDYFNDAWAMRPRSSHWFGQPHWQGWSEGDGGVMYRWHIPDPVRFTRSLKVTMEHKGNAPLSEDAWYIERPDFFSSVAFWYQTGEPAPFGELPGYPERCVPWVTHHLVRTFRRARAEGAARLKVQSTGMFGGRPVLAWEDAQPGDRITLPFTVEEDGRYVARLMGFPGGEGGTGGGFAVEIDGKEAHPAVTFRPSGFSRGYVMPDAMLGTHELTKGEHTLTFRPAAPDARSLGVETLRLLKLPPPAVRSPKTNNEAHFYRIGIGRAVYAYRLAYDELPESLQALHESGLLDARYLNDENGYPLESGCEGEGAERRFAVRSTAPQGWTHSWRGLDARR